MTDKSWLDEYMDVAERIQAFYAKYPEGSLQGEGKFMLDGDSKITGFLYTARAYRDQNDIRPSIGTALEPIPGKTPYTRDSEVQNAETSAWGRAIVAAGIPAKKIASRQEVEARQGSGRAPSTGEKTGEATRDGEGAVRARPETTPMIGHQRKGLKRKIEELIAAENSVVTWETIDKSCITSYGHSFDALSAEEAVDLWNRLKKYEQDVAKITAAEASA